MITAEKLQELTTLNPVSLTELMQNSAVISDAKFLGITNGGQFCYKVVYDLHGEEEFGKVFVTFNHQTGLITGDL